MENQKIAYAGIRQSNFNVGVSGASAMGFFLS
jgi:hypothetical protein